MKNWPLVATTGVERGEALQHFRASLIGGLAVGAPTGVIMILGTWWIACLLPKDKLIAGFVAQIDGTLELDTSAGITAMIVFPHSDRSDPEPARPARPTSPKAKMTRVGFEWH